MNILPQTLLGTVVALAVTVSAQAQELDVSDAAIIETQVSRNVAYVGEAVTVRGCQFDCEGSGR